MLRGSRSRTRPPPRRGSTSPSPSPSDLAGWRPELGPLANPMLWRACSHTEGLSRLRQCPVLREMAIAAGLFVMADRRCYDCGGVHEQVVLTPRGRVAWDRYRLELAADRAVPNPRPSRAPRGR